MVNVLIAEGADVNVKSWYGWNALYSAAIKDKPVILKALLNGQADVNIADANGLTPIMGAALWGRRENVETLRSAGASFTNDLVFSAALGELHDVQLFLERKQSANTWNAAGRSPLAAAAANGHLGIVNFLLDHGADVNSEGKDGSVTNSALLFAAQNGHFEVVKTLLSKKATTKTNSAGETLLFAAVDRGHSDIAKLLLDNGSDPNGKKPDGEPVLFSAAQKHAEIIAPLVKAGANINATNAVGSTPLIIAAYYGNADSVLTLLSLGARVSAKTTEGFTALQVARSLRNREQIIEILSNPEEAERSKAQFKRENLNKPID
jgi:ankyrin repeat protein